MAHHDNPEDRCAVCAREVGPGGGFCRFYADGARISFCASACATAYLRGPERSHSSPGGDLIAELVEEWKWTWGHGVQHVLPAGASALETASDAERALAGRSRVVASRKHFELPSHENGSCAY